MMKTDCLGFARLSARLLALLLVLSGMQAHSAFAAGPPKAGSVFKDCKDCPEMVVIPPGEFLMGRDGGEPERYEGPPHQVKINYAFAAGRFELTNGQYRKFVAATGHKTAGAPCNGFIGDKFAPLPGTKWSDPGYGRPIRDDEPVACIRWSDAQSYVSWLAGRTGKKYRLLTEAEWEYAAWAGASGLYAWGDDATVACKYANIHDLSGARNGAVLSYGPAPCDDGFEIVSPVGRLAPNAFGLYDMIGNVWEWVEDCYQMPYGDTPVDGSANLTTGCDRRASKGGSWRSNYTRQRPSFRGRDPEALTSQIFGTRIARDL